MKSILSISLALVILLNSLSRVLIVMDYQLNKDYIARVLCINRDKPQMGCNGKCHLKKQLQKADEQEKKTGSSREGKSEWNWLCQSTYLFQPARLVVQVNLPVSSYQLPRSVAHLLGVFQPPQE